MIVSCAHLHVKCVCRLDMFLSEHICIHGHMQKEIWAISWVGARRQLGRAGGGMPPEDRALAQLSECLLHALLLLLLFPPPGWQLGRGGMRDVRWEAWGRGQQGDGAKPSLISPSSHKHLTCAEMPPGGWAARWAGKWLVLVWWLCFTACAQRFAYNAGVNMIQNQTCQGKIQSSSITRWRFAAKPAVPFIFSRTRTRGAACCHPLRQAAVSSAGSVTTGLCGVAPSVTVYTRSAFGSHLPS